MPESASISSYNTSCNKNQSVQHDNKQVKIEAYSENRHVPGGKIPNLGKWILRQMMALALILLIDVGIPLALYYGLRNVLDVLYSLIISGIPPFLWVIYGFIRHRRIDALGLIIGLSFIVSGVISLINGKFTLWHCWLIHLTTCLRDQGKLVLQFYEKQLSQLW